MENRREFGRFDTQLKAQYFIRDERGDSGECTIINISRKGVGIRFNKQANITEGANIHLEVTIPTELDPVTIRGVLKHIKQEGDDFIVGVESDKVLDEAKFSMLD